MIDRDLPGTLPSRRQVLRRAGTGFGSMALAALLSEEASPAPTPGSPVAAPLPFPGAGERVIFLFMPGGPSQVDTFDPKPRLTRDHGKPAPKLYLGQQRNLLASPWPSTNGASPASR